MSRATTSIFHILFLIWSFVLTSTLAALPPNTNLRILPLGDSITYGMGSSTRSSYRGALYKALVAEGANVQMIGTQKSGNFAQPNHEGYSGYTISQISAKADNSLPKKPNVILLMAGTNDISWAYMMGQSKETAPDRLGALIDKLTNAVPDAVVLVATLTPLGGGMGGGFSLFGSSSSSGGGVNEYNAKIPAVVKARADRGKKVAVVDMSAVKQSELADGVHPNDAGYAKMATAWLKAIEDAAAKGWIVKPA